MGLEYELNNECEPNLECDLRVSHENVGPKHDCHVISECYVIVSYENVVRTRPQNSLDCLVRQKQTGNSIFNYLCTLKLLSGYQELKLAPRAIFLVVRVDGLIRFKTTNLLLWLCSRILCRGACVLKAQSENDTVRKVAVQLTTNRTRQH